MMTVVLTVMMIMTMRPIVKIKVKMFSAVHDHVHDAIEMEGGCD